MPIATLLAAALQAYVPATPRGLSVPHAAVRMELEEAGALARPGELGSTLEQALGALPANEKYNAVLESLI